MVELFGFSVVLDIKLALMCTVVFVAGIIRGFLGFGSALLIVPALSVLYGPALAVVIGVLIEIPTSLGLLPVAIRQAERRTVTKMLLTFLVFVPVGTLLLKSVNPEWMKVVISLVVLVMVGIIALQERMVVLLSHFGTLFAGATSGVAQGMTGMAGPLFVTALLARGESAIQTRANIVALAGGLITISATSFILACHSSGCMGRIRLVSTSITLESARRYTGVSGFNRTRHPGTDPSVNADCINCRAVARFYGV